MDLEKRRGQLPLNTGVHSDSDAAGSRNGRNGDGASGAMGASAGNPGRCPTRFKGRNMSGQVASTLGPTGQDSSQLDEPVVDQRPSVEQPQQEEPPAEIQDITPGKEEVSGEDPVNHDEEKEKDAPGDSDLESHLQELAVAKTGGQGGDGPDVKEEIASNTETVELPEE
ncbi:X antigen family member 5-like isoform X3 [Muntiacus reevesi]